MSPLNRDRADAIERAVSPNPLYLPLSPALRLATVSMDERLLEIKSSYIIAYVTLGLSYVSGPGLDQVRDIIASGKLESSATCGTVPANEIPAGDWVLVADGPIECLLVTHPTHHTAPSGYRHVVILPMPNSAPGFYRRLSLLMRKPTWNIARDDLYEQPIARRLPRCWDQNGSPHGFSGEREFEVVGQPTSTP